MVVCDLAGAWFSSTMGLGVGWLKRTKYRMDWPSGVSTHGWLAHCPLLTCPMYCGFFAGWHDVFWPQSQQSFHCNKRVKWSQHNQQKWAQAVWPTGLPAAHMLPPVLSCGPATCCPFVALFCSNYISKGISYLTFVWSDLLLFSEKRN